MKGEVSPDPESLAAHRGFVEALARRLVDDRHVAEDLAQETFLAALRNPPKAAALRGFLARVLRRRRARWLRDEDRRLRKERAAARPDRAESGLDLVARLSWHRKVVDALLSLEEPYRTTLLLRFYEDLKPGEIAERLDVPPGTVRARLSRGLERMRARLDADHEGDRRSWQLGLLPLLSCARPRGVLLGVAAMTAGKKVVAAGALVLALAGTGYVTLRTLQREAPPARSDAPRGAVPVAEVHRAPGPTSIPEQGSTLVVHVRNERDEPIAGAEVLVLHTPAEGAFRTPPVSIDRRWAHICRNAETVAFRAATDGSGEARLHGLTGNRWDLVARAPGRAPARRTVQGEQQAQVTLTLLPARALRGLVVDTTGTPVAGAVVLAGTPALAWWRGTAERPFRAVADERGEYAFDALPAEDMSLFAAFPGGLAFHVATLRHPGPERFDITLRRGGTVTGSVLDGSGRPVAGADVFLHGQDEHTACPGHATTDVSGRYMIDTLPPCSVHSAVVEAPGHVVSRGIEDVLYLRDGEKRVLDFRLVRAARIRGTALGPAGPVSRTSVMSFQLGLEGGYVQRHAVTDDEGRFVLDDLPPGRAVLNMAGGGHRQEGFPQDQLGALRSGDGESPWIVELREGEEVEYVARLVRGDIDIEGIVLGPDGLPFAGARVIVAGGPSCESAADGTFRLEHVFADAGVVRVSAPGMRQVGPWPLIASRVTLQLERRPDPRLTGTVRGPEGEAPAGAYVLVALPGYNERSGRPANDMSVTTERARRWYSATRHPVTRSGTFDVPLQGVVEEHKRLWVRAGAPGMADAEPVEITLEEGRDRYEAGFVLSPGNLLEGTVVDAGTGKPVMGARVKVRRTRPVDEPLPQGAIGPEEAVAAVTDEAGEFAARDLGSGWWEIEAAARGFAAGSTRFELPPRGRARVALARTLSIAGQVVLPDGSPVPAAFVQVDGMPGRDPLPSRILSTDATGRFVAEDLAPGEYRVRVAESRTANIVETALPDVAAGAPELRIVVERASTISGVVVDKEGRGIHLMHVTAVSDTGDAPGGFAQTREDGAFDIRGLRDGAYKLTFRASDRTDRTEVVRRQVRTGTATLKVTFEPAADERLSIEGILVDETGAPVAERWIRTAGKGRKRAQTDAQGRFVIRELEPGGHALVLERRHGATNYVAALGSADAGATGERLVARVGGAIAGTVSDGSGPLRNVWVHVDARDGDFPIAAETDKSGAFRVAGLPDGATCTVFAGDGVFIRTTIRDVAVGTTDVRIVLRRGLSASGRLVDGDGAPLASATLRFLHASGAKGAKTDADGRFHVMGMEPGRYQVEAHLYHGGFRPCGTIEAGATDVELRLPAK